MAERRLNPEDDGMRARIQGMAALAVLLWTCQGQGDELIWRPAAHTSTPSAGPAVTLGRPEPLRPVSYIANTDEDSHVNHYEPLAPVSPRLLVRGQAAEPAPPPPPPPPAGFGGAPVAGPNPGEEAYNCGVANTATSGGGFWSGFCDKIKGYWSDVSGSVTGAGERNLFQSDHKFDGFASPVSNPFYFEDPRALTEVRPIFIWQHTPNSNPIFAGGNNFFVGARGSVAFTDWLSLTIDELGWVFADPRNPVGDFHSANGFSEFHVGPKVTFIRNDTSGTVAAFGITFEVPTGPKRVFQNTHDFGMTPYFSIAQNFLRSDFGSFNFMNTDGYSRGFGSPRGDFFYASFHLDYDVGNLKKIYPLVELNYTYYAANGQQEPINFEGRDLFHFGAGSVHGLNELTVALGLRYKVSEALQFGLVGEFNVLTPSREMDAFRLTFDVIFRY